MGTHQLLDFNPGEGPPAEIIRKLLQRLVALLQGVGVSEGIARPAAGILVIVLIIGTLLLIIYLKRKSEDKFKKVRSPLDEPYGRR